MEFMSLFSLGFLHFCTTLIPFSGERALHVVAEAIETSTAQK